jgi:uncharacterized peroxidase-related enzyme
MPFFSYLDEQSDITHILLHDSKRYGPLNELAHQLLRGPSELTAAQRELLGAYISRLNACTYCSGVHAAVAEQMGVASSMLEALFTDIDTAPVDDRLKPIFRYAEKLTLHPAKMIQSDADKVLAANWSEKTLEDVIGITALFSFYNRLLDGHGIKGNSGIYMEGAGHLSKRGYRLPRIVAMVLKQYRKWKVT